jgi:hypothetical protein
MTFQPPSKSLTKKDYQFIAAVLAVVLIFSTVLIFANLKLAGGGGDFYVHWVAVRGFAVDKIEPYSGDVAGRVQQLVYGTSAQKGDEPYILDTPFFILLFYFPFALLSDPALARAVFALILELALFALIFLSLRLTDWESPRLFTVLFTLFGIFNFYSVHAIYEASPVILLGLVYAFILITYYAEMDELTGALIVASLYYWEVGAPFLILILLRVYRQGRSRVFTGMAMSIFLLLAVTFLLYPDWIIPYLRAATNNLRADFGFSIFDVLSKLLPSNGILIARIVVLVLFLILGYEFGKAQSSDFRRFYWTTCLAISAAPLLGLRTEMEHLAILLIPLAFVFSLIHDRWRQINLWFTPLLLALIFALPWGIQIWARNNVNVFHNEIVFLFLPVLTIVGLYWIRWWALRPPRVWADMITKS